MQYSNATKPDVKKYDDFIGISDLRPTIRGFQVASAAQSADTFVKKKPLERFWPDFALVA